MFKLLRYYAIASFVAIVATAIFLTWLYRQVAMQDIVELAQRSNLQLTKTALTPMTAALLQFLEEADNAPPGAPAPPPSAELRQAINTLMQERFVVRIKIYGRDGRVVFSTKPQQIGKDQSDNEGFIAAVHGGVGNSLVYRDTFNTFDSVTEEDNLMQTYVPVRAGPAEPIQGVFELYADVNNLVHQTERIQFLAMGGSILILSALYGVLILVVRRASKTIELQQKTIRERTETLELLAAHMLTSEESNKKKIASELHEGVAQTLAALKMRFEDNRRKKLSGDVPAAAPDVMVPALQDAIEEVTTIATDLRPASLDELGLLSTISWVCREFEQTHPGISLRREIAVSEEKIPPALKIILYRIIASVLGEAGEHSDAGRIFLALQLDHDELILSFDHTWDAPMDYPQHRAGARMEQLATLSGGSFTASHRVDGAALRAAWSRQASHALANVA